MGEISRPLADDIGQWPRVLGASRLDVLVLPNVHYAVAMPAVDVHLSGGRLIEVGRSNVPDAEVVVVNVISVLDKLVALDVLFL